MLFKRLQVCCFIAFVLMSMTCVGQHHPLVGTWEMVSIKGIDAEGEPFFRDTTTTREVKIITPTHYMLIASDVRADSLIFNRSYAGTVAINGDNYIETPVQSSLPIFSDVKADYKWKLDGDYFIQSGSVTRPDGKKVVLEALIFKRVVSPKGFDQNPAIGTWSQLSSSYIDFDGNRKMHTRDQATRLHIITPTHWMRISHRNKKFENAMAGSYKLVENVTIPTLEYASYRFEMNDQVSMSERVDGNKLYVTGKLIKADGRTMTWEDVFERVP